MCSIDKSIDKISRYFWYRDTKKYRGIRDTSIVKFWYRDISVSPIPTYDLTFGKISNGHISARGRPIHFMFGSTWDSRGRRIEWREE